MSFAIAVGITLSYVPLVLVMILADHLRNRTEDDARIERRLEAIPYRVSQRDYRFHE